MNSIKQIIVLTICLLTLTNINTETLDSIKCSTDPSDTVYCSNSETCCMLPDDSWGCCPYRLATCCSDRIHCCPYNYACNLRRLTCDYKSQQKELLFLEKEIVISKISFK